MIDFEPMRRAWIAVIVLVAMLAGCGDAAKVCELYSEQLIRSLKTSDCVAFVQEQTTGTATDLAVLRVTENGDQARATIQAKVGGNIANAIAPIELTLTKQRGEWRISGLG
jgi:ABC-type uncharacterized transport system auxiliary subunit